MKIFHADNYVLPLPRFVTSQFSSATGHFVFQM